MIDAAREHDHPLVVDAALLQAGHHQPGADIRAQAQEMGAVGRADPRTRRHVAAVGDVTCGVGDVQRVEVGQARHRARDVGIEQRAVDVGRRGTVSLRDVELRILARHPLPAGAVIGATLPVPPLQALLAAGRDAGGYVTDHTVDGVERKFAVRRISGQPLYVVVGRATGEYLEPWRHQVARTGALLALFAAITLAFAVVIYQAWRRRRSALDALVREEAELRASEARLNDAQRIAHVGNWELDLAHNVLVWSDEIYRMFEIDPGAFGASYEAFLDTIHPDDRDLVNRAYTESVASRTPYDIVHRLLMKDGRIKYVNERCETDYDAAGQPVRSMGTVHDITERKRAEDEIIELNRALEERVVQRTAQLETANQELEAFAYSVSHDLRAPLRAIEGFSHILEEDYGGQLDGEGLRLLGVVRSNVKRMACLIGDILDFSRMGRRELRAVAVDMNRLAHEVAEELQAATSGRVLRFEIADLPPAQGDRALLRQVLTNLMDNAVKFTQLRTEAVVEVGGATQAGENVYYVKDNGVGFDMRYADKLFGVFERLHAQEQFEGTGIGLAIVKRVVVRHGGRVWAQGAVGEGAAFSFALPRT